MRRKTTRSPDGDLPFHPAAGLFDFTPLSLSFLFMLGMTLGLYITAAEMAKRIFYLRAKFSRMLSFDGRERNSFWRQ